jgi:hypothetical protein
VQRRSPEVLNSDPKSVQKIRNPKTEKDAISMAPSINLKKGDYLKITFKKFNGI